MNCPSCEKEIPDKSIFCLHCGKPIALSKEKVEDVSMENKDLASQKGTNVSRKPNLMKIVVEIGLVSLVTYMIATFGAGFGAFRLIIEIANLEIVPKDCCIPKEELVGKILKAEAIREIDYLIEIGEDVKNNDTETRTWLSRVLAFIHGLDLEKDSEWDGVPMAAVEADIRYVFLDPSIEIQRQKTLGILQGFKAAFQTRVTNP